MTDRPTWSEVQSRLEQLPPWALASFTVRSARRLWPTILACENAYGSEAREWLAACDATLRMVELFAAREPVSRFTLDLAAEIARATALVLAHTARRVGFQPSAHTAELALAAAALSADVARTKDPSRAVRAAIQAAQTCTNGEAIQHEQCQDLSALEQGEPLLELWTQPIPCHVVKAYQAVESTISKLIR